MNKSQSKWHHTHPVTIIFNMRHYFYLVILPVARSFAFSFSSDFKGWLSGAWFDLLVVFIMVLLATFQWWWCRYQITPEAFFYRQGLIFTRSTQMPWKNVVTLSARHPYYLRPFKVCVLRLDTWGGSQSDIDISMYIKNRDLSLIRTQGKQKLFVPEKQPFHPKKNSVVLMSLISNTSFLGVVYLATFIYNAGRLFGNQFSDLIVGTVESFARRTAAWISPSAAVIAIFLILGWLIGFVLTMFRFYGFSASRVDSRIVIQSGLFSPKRYSVQSGDISYVDISQNLITYLARVYTLSFSAAGCSKTKDDLNCLIPLSHWATIEYQLNHFFPNQKVKKRSLRPKIDGFIRYVGGSFVICVVAGIVIGHLIKHFTQWRTFILFAGIMIMIPLTLFLIIRFLAFFKSGVGFEKESYTLYYSKWFTLHTLVIPKKNLSYVVVYQSIWQRLGGTCDLWIYTKGEGKSKHICRGLRKKEVLAYSFL